jgi:signal transduction histidine kinase
MKLDSAEVLLVGDEAGARKPSAMNKTEAEIPIMEKDKKIGAILLGKKKSDEPYTEEDMDILFPLAHALAIAISNARLFEKLSAAKAEAAQKEKMASIGTLAAGMAHEIRNPITTIRTFADYLPERYRDRGFMDTFNRLIPGEIDRVERITGSLLEFSHSEDTAIKETVDIPGIVNIILSLLKPQYRFSGVEIISDFRGDGRVVANKGQIRDAIFNIVKYMLSEMPRNSVLKIEVTGTDNEVTAAIGTPDMAIEEYIIKDVLEPVSSLYRERRGFGFDIFVARQLIEGAGGDFRISSDGSIGTQFRIRFDKTSARPS